MKEYKRKYKYLFVNKLENGYNFEGKLILTSEV